MLHATSKHTASSCMHALQARAAPERLNHTWQLQQAFIAPEQFAA
jgi:hypothetical protein